MADASAPRNNRRFSTKHELQKAYVARAKEVAEAGSVPSTFPVFASCQQIGATFGVGVGLYFKLLQWLACIFLLLSITAVPYFVVINTSVFTDANHKHDHGFGVKVYEKPHLFSLTFIDIVDSSVDNDTLQYMNTQIAGVWHGPMTKATFLTWISIVDAAAVVLLLALITYITLQAHHFIQTVDARTLEVSDYTVLIQGLPRNANPHELGSFFSRFGEVMDVVLVRDIRPVLAACSRASRLEQQRDLLKDQIRMYNSVLHVQRAERVEKQLESLLTQLEGYTSGPKDFPVKAAFITFNHELEAAACLENLPKSWWTSRFQPRVDCLRHKYGLYARPAFAPEDYIHENIPCGWVGRLARRLFTRVVVLGMLVLTAFLVTRLSSISIHESRSIAWDQDRMKQDIGKTASMLVPVPPTSKTITNTGVVLGNATHTVTTALYELYRNAVDTAAQLISQTGNYVLPTGLDKVVSQQAEWASYCTAALPQVCAPFYAASVDAQGFNISYGSLLQWSVTNELLLKQRPLVQSMTSCALGNADDACHQQSTHLALGACLPCFCLGLSTLDSTQQSAEWANDARNQCGVYIDSWNVRSWGIRIAIALVIAAINYAIKFVVEYLVVLEKHWTHSQQERSYAVVVFIAQLLNSALVLIIVNASPVADASSNAHEQESWLRYLVLNGQYGDFSPAWYREVGLSIMVLMMIQVVTPVITVCADAMLKVWQRCWLLKCSENATQSQYNEVFSRPKFELAQRVSDAMLNVGVALMFGSGMPVLYPMAFIIFVVTILVERHALARLCAVTSRYSYNLPKLILAVIPWAALVHCLFGVWMHSYFKVVPADDTPSLLNLDGASSAGRMKAGSSPSDDFSVDRILDRITAANSIPLLACAGVLVLWLLFRCVLWRLAQPLLLMVARKCCSCFTCCDPQSQVNPSDTMALEIAMVSRRLRGVTTYRLPHHPGYKGRVFDGRLHKAIWLRAQGRHLYTRLVSGRGGPEHMMVSQEVVTTVENDNLEEVVGKLPSGLANIATRLATQSVDGHTSNGGSPNHSNTRFWPSRSAPRLAVQTSGALQATDSQTVHIQVMAEPGSPHSSSLHSQTLLAGFPMDKERSGILTSRLISGVVRVGEDTEGGSVHSSSGYVPVYRGVAEEQARRGSPLFTSPDPSGRPATQHSAPRPPPIPQLMSRNPQQGSPFAVLPSRVGQLEMSGGRVRPAGAHRHLIHTAPPAVSEAVRTADSGFLLDTSTTVGEPDVAEMPGITQPGNVMLLMQGSNGRA